jgi:hypothetical protein
MQLFFPSVILVIVAFIIIFLVMPKLSPLVIVTISAILLVAGTYNHFVTFWNEYQQSTWQNNLKIFAPGIFIAILLVYIFVVLSSIFTGGSVPVPTLPNVELPSAESATNPVTAAINSTMNGVNSAMNSVTNAATNAMNTVSNSVGLGNSNAPKNNAPKNNGVTRSALATV